MMDEPRHKRRRRSPIQVEPLEGRALLSAVKATTPPRAVELVLRPSSQNVNQKDGSFTVTLSLKNQKNARAAATLDEPLTVDFRASISPYYNLTPEAASAIFAPVHESVTIPAGASTQTVTVPIHSSATRTVSTPIMLMAGPPLGSKVDPAYQASVNLYSSPVAYPPTIAGIGLVTQGKLASAVVVSFSKPMARATVENIQNYRILSRPTRTEDKGFLFWGGSATTVIRSFPIATASYDPSTLTVTLTLKQPTRASSLYEVASAWPLGMGNALTDTNGQPLVGTSAYGYGLGGFTNLIHPIPGFTPRAVGPLRITRKTDSPASKLNPMHGFS